MGRYQGLDKAMNALFAKVILRDALARSWAIILAISCMLLAVTSVVGEGVEGLGAARSLMVLVALFFGVVMVLRAATVSALLTRGAQAEGMVVGRPAGEAGPGMTRYDFVHDNVRVEGRAFMAQGLEPGQRITVAYDPVRPEVSVIRDIFS